MSQCINYAEIKTNFIDGDIGWPRTIKLVVFQAELGHEIFTNQLIFAAKMVFGDEYERDNKT